MAKKYAERTTVPVERSKAQIDKLLKEHGAFQRAQVTDELRALNLVMFSMEVAGRRRQVRLELPHHPNNPAEDRRIWRVLFMSLKMKLERIRAGDSDLDSEFLPNVVLPDGRVLSQALAGQLDAMYDHGGMPPLLGPAP